MATSATMSTKISKRSNSRIRSTLPRDLAREIDIYDRDQQHIQYAVKCNDGGIALELTIGPDVDPSAMNVICPIVHSSGQVELELPVFQMEAWNLVDCEVDWPESEDVEIDGETATIYAPILEWKPKYDVDMFSASASFAHSSTISVSGEERQNIQSMLPTNPANDVGLTESNMRAEVTFDCVDGKKVMVLTPTSKDRSDLRNSLSVHLGGPNKSQPRINAGRVAADLEVRAVLEEQPVPLRWFNQESEHLIGFVREDGQ